MPDPFVGPPELGGPLTPREIGLFESYFPGEDWRNLTLDTVREAIKSYVPGGGPFHSGTGTFEGTGGRGLMGLYDLAAQMQGIQDAPPAEMRAGGIMPGPNGGGSTSLEQADYAVNHAQTYIPIPFRMHHHRAGSGLHLAMMGRTIVLKFHQKKSCAAFCRMWNMMFAHIGSADEFIPADVIQAFANMLIGGSGAIGLENNFNPPFPGRGI